MTRLSLLVVGAAILTVGCGSSSPTEPSGSSTTIFTVPLSSANEVPAITNADAGSTGTAVVTLRVT
jgi:ABC-type glycerol-3-phosphate transport system substrate-binding protein